MPGSHHPSTFTKSIIVEEQISRINPFACSNTIKSCTSVLYHHNVLDKESISTHYNVSPSDIYPISRNNVNDTKQDYLVEVPCSCKDVNGTIGYFYETPYILQTNDDPCTTISIDTYSGQAWKVGGKESVTSPLVTTYTVQPEDTLLIIADLLSSQVGDILRLNPYLNQTQGFVGVGWLIYVPMNPKSRIL
nr:lysM domain receptor-like kinase 3 [Ipomoea batatas]